MPIQRRNPPSRSQSSSSSSSSSSSGSSKTASLHPHDFDREIDIIEELKYNKDLYINGDQWVTLLIFPTDTRSMLKRLTAFANKNHNLKIGLHSVMGCCISCGIGILIEEKVWKNTVNLSDDILTLDDIDDGHDKELEDWYTNFNLGVSNFGASSVSKYNLRLTKVIKESLSSSATKLGISTTSLALLAISRSLMSQDSTKSSHRRDLEEAIRRFFVRLEVRYDVAQMWMDKIKKMPKRVEWSAYRTSKEWSID